MTNPRAFDAKKFDRDENQIVKLKSNRDKMLQQKTFIIGQLTRLTNINKRIYRERISCQTELTNFEVKSNQNRCYVTL